MSELTDALREMAAEQGYKVDLKDCELFAAAADEIDRLASRLKGYQEAAVVTGERYAVLEQQLVTAQSRLSECLVANGDLGLLLAKHCACQHDERGELVEECDEHERIRTERDQLSSRLNELLLPWRDMLPTVPGHYWNRQKPPHEDLLTIRAVFSITRGNGEVTFYADGPGLSCADLGGEWAGPILPPQPLRVVERQTP